MTKLEETKRVVKVIKELEFFKLKLIQDTNDIIIKLEKILIDD